MKSGAYLRFALIAMIVAGSSPEVRAQSAGTTAARILSVKCAALLKTTAASSPISLREPQDVGRSLTAGNQLQCSGAGYMEIFVPEGTEKIVASMGWSVINPVPPKPPYPEIANALIQYGIPGATRGQTSSSRILWPADNSTIIPEHFAIRWTPIPQKITLSILSEAKDTTLWGPIEVDGTAGSLTSNAVDEALALYKKKSAATSLVLTLSVANANNWDESHFSILSGQQEKELTTQLDFWNKNEEGLALHLGLAYSYTRHKLFAEAAEEYDSAVNFAPGSRFLLEEAIQANRLAGNASRVKELQARLPSQP